MSSLILNLRGDLKNHFQPQSHFTYQLTRYVSPNINSVTQEIPGTFRSPDSPCYCPWNTTWTGWRAWISPCPRFSLRSLEPGTCSPCWTADGRRSNGASWTDAWTSRSLYSKMSHIIEISMDNLKFKRVQTRLFNWLIWFLFIQLTVYSRKLLNNDIYKVNYENIYV